MQESHINPDGEMAVLLLETGTGARVKEQLFVFSIPFFLTELETMNDALREEECISEDETTCYSNQESSSSAGK